MSEFIDVQALRRESLEGFQAGARTYFDKHPEMHSLVLAVSQYFADEAGDAVHEHVYAFPSREPSWPHRCSDEGSATDGARCTSCDWGNVPRGTLDSNAEAVFAWSAFCTEWGGGEGNPSLADPIAIARRAENGEVDLELVHELIRPWMDTNGVAAERDEEMWDEEAPAPAPEPMRDAWTRDERRLLDAVLADPTNDAPRRVLVDFWLEKEDVRGEFGALSFATPTSAAARARRLELESLHGRRWLGPLQPCITLGAATFARGPFVASAIVSGKQPLEDVEDWAFLDSVRFLGPDVCVSPKLRGLRRALGLEPAHLEAMTRISLRAPIHTVSLATPIAARDWARCGALANVRQLVVENGTEEAAWLLSLPVWPALESLEVWLGEGSGEENSDDWREEAPQHWADDRGRAVLKALTPRLGPNTRLCVGYEFVGGRRGGVVATVRSGVPGVVLENRQFASAEARANAEKRLR